MNKARSGYRSLRNKNNAAFAGRHNPALPVSVDRYADVRPTNCLLKSFPGDSKSS
jgi:hypothetical protein